MKLKAVLDSLDNVPAEIHAFYVEKDGKWYLDLDDDIKTHPSVSALSNAYQAEKTKRTAATAKVTTLEARLAGLPDDFDATAYEDLKAKAEANDGKTVDERIQLVTAQAERRAAAEKVKTDTAIKERDDKIAAKDALLERNVVEGGLSQAMDEANIDPKHKKKLAPYLRSLGKIKVAEEDGTVSAIVETDMGPISLSKFVADWAASEDGKEYVGKPTGLGAGGGNGGRQQGANPFVKANWSKTEQSKIVSSDRGKAEQMAKSAGFRNLDAAIAAAKPVTV